MQDTFPELMFGSTMNFSLKKLTTDVSSNIQLHIKIKYRK